MSDRDLLTLRVLLTRVASQLAQARSERDPEIITEQLVAVRSRIDGMIGELAT